MSTDLKAQHLRRGPGEGMLATPLGGRYCFDYSVQELAEAIVLPMKFWKVRHSGWWLRHSTSGAAAVSRCHAAGVFSGQKVELEHFQLR